MERERTRERDGTRRRQREGWSEQESEKERGMERGGPREGWSEEENRERGWSEETERVYVLVRREPDVLLGVLRYQESIVDHHIEHTILLQEGLEEVSHLLDLPEITVGRLTLFMFDLLVLSLVHISDMDHDHVSLLCSTSHEAKGCAPYNGLVHSGVCRSTHGTRRRGRSREEV